MSTTYYQKKNKNRQTKKVGKSKKFHLGNHPWTL